jgi:hypothetical protein
MPPGPSHAVVGAGTWGTTLALLLSRAGPVTLLTRDATHAARLRADGENARYLPGGLAGIGDIIAACSSPLSHNHRLGVELAGAAAGTTSRAPCRAWPRALTRFALPSSWPSDTAWTCPSPAKCTPCSTRARMYARPWPTSLAASRRTSWPVWPDRLRVQPRGVAQPGSALDWGSRGRWFKSSRPDHTSEREMDLGEDSEVLRHAMRPCRTSEA